MFKLIDRKDQTPIPLQDDLLALLQYNHNFNLICTKGNITITMFAISLRASHVIVVDCPIKGVHYQLKTCQPRQGMIEIVPVWQALYQIVQAELDEDPEVDKAYNYLEEQLLKPPKAWLEQAHYTPDLCAYSKAPLKGAKVGRIKDAKL